MPLCLYLSRLRPVDTAPCALIGRDCLGLRLQYIFSGCATPFCLLSSLAAIGNGAQQMNNHDALRCLNVITFDIDAV